MDIPENPTPEELEEMRAAVEAEDQRIAQEAIAARAAKLAPLRAILDSNGFKTVLNGLRDIRDGGTLSEEPNIAPHLDALVTIMPVLDTNAN